MRSLFEIDEWKVIERSFDPLKQKQAESIFSIGNGSFGQRANFEEKYSGDSLLGSYVGGVYYPDKTRVGWWKNGYPEYFAKVLNSCNWIGINMEVNGLQIDLASAEVLSFYRELDMKSGTLKRIVVLRLEDGKEMEIDALRFCSMDDEDIAAISYAVTPLNFSGIVRFTPYLNGRVSNHDSNYNEFFWYEHSREIQPHFGLVCAKTKKTEFVVANAMRYTFSEGNKQLEIIPHLNDCELYVESSFDYELMQGKKYFLHKYVSIAASIKYPENEVERMAISCVENAFNSGFNGLLDRHVKAWESIWQKADIVISGDSAAQQGIRFNIFHLYQTYTGKNAKLNIGPKGFTGEKYGGATYWDTEAYCLPFYLKTADYSIARQLLIYRFNHLQKAIENAEKLGFKNGAALYPMVTMNGEECHNEWEITFEEIHRNGAIAFGIYNYIRHTNDKDYLKEFGFPVLLAIARFWAQRFNWSESKNAFVMLGVTGPNEYENNVNNNWYTNYIARWCIDYCLKIQEELGNESNPKMTEKEVSTFRHIIENIYFPQLTGTSIFLQQEGFMDKEQLSASDIPRNERPINQYWSWDRILRSVFIKQADVLQGLYLFEEFFDAQTIKENFDFYEPKTVHESSLSPCIHVILAAKIGNLEKAYELYLRTSRLDLDDYNQEAEEGLHITSMAGTWMSLVEGFAGIRITEKGLQINPTIPSTWTAYSFQILYLNLPIHITVSKNSCIVLNKSQNLISFKLNDMIYELESSQQIIISY